MYIARSLKNIIMDPNGTNIPKHTHNCAKHTKCDSKGLNGTATRGVRIMKTGNVRLTQHCGTFG